jgi:hypothetical protein
VSSIRCAPLPSNEGDGDKPLLLSAPRKGRVPFPVEQLTAKAVMVQVGGVLGVLHHVVKRTWRGIPPEGFRPQHAFIQRVGCNSRKGLFNSAGGGSFRPRERRNRG